MWWPIPPEVYVSRETTNIVIYGHPQGELLKDLVACLRQCKSGRKPRSGGDDRKGQTMEVVSIHLRPPEVMDRVMPGRWQGDLIQGMGNKCAIRVLVQRTARLVPLAREPDVMAESPVAAFNVKLMQIAQPMRQKLTYGRGKEMARHSDLTSPTNVLVYFGDQHNPLQPGSHENTNGLQREILPNEIDTSVND